MYFTGFADEAAKDFDMQIKATKELGWNHIESRGIGSKTLATLNEAEFEIISEKLNNSGVSINCYGSAIANWGKDPRNQNDFDSSLKELVDVIPRMQKLGIPMLRGMSFAVVQDVDPESPEIAKEVFSKVKKLVEICEEAGILYLHENCMNYGGMSHVHTLRLLEKINSPYFKLVFDTGNPLMTYDRSGAKPYKKQNAFDFYKQVKESIHYIHIKDGIYKKETEGIFPEATWTFPGEGEGHVREIVADLLKNGYDGGFSMEPHMSIVFHEETADQVKEDARYQNYVEYGRIFMNLVNSVTSAQED
jgi:sugar phosphate isomerase/epimerase